MLSESWKSNPERIEVKNTIKLIFDENVKGKTPELLSFTPKHDGQKGHWLQVQFGLTADAKNAPDFQGFELKDNTRTKTTFGDWPADEYLFFSHLKCQANDVRAASCFKCCKSKIGRSEFLQIFGTPNPKKQNRPSWSGTVFPKIGTVNQFGQGMWVSRDLGVIISYDFDADKRKDKHSLVPMSLQRNELTLARWSGESLRRKLENKFCKFGWFKCIQQGRGKNAPYVAITFGGPIQYEYWIDQVKKGVVYLDSGMHEGNPRPYSSWRANNSFWASLVEETYP